MIKNELNIINNNQIKLVYSDNLIEKEIINKINIIENKKIWLKLIIENLFNNK